MSYRDYLQAKSFEDDVRSDISKQTRSIIASNEELQREHIRVLEASSEAVSSGFEQLSYDIHALSEEVARLGAAIHWGFSQLLMQAARMNDTLEELLKIAKTPAQTWAYEQYEIARDAFRRELFDDALDYLNRAINGYAGNTGYKLEHRFYYLLGAIRMGSFRNTSPEIVSLEQAEQAFLTAAKYARSDSDFSTDAKMDAKRFAFVNAVKNSKVGLDYRERASIEANRGQACLSYLAAGRAAYCQGKIAEAVQYTQLASKCDFPIVHFQMAKLRMHQGDPDSALESLKKAIEGDRAYSLKAAEDADFRPYKIKVDALIAMLCEQARKEADAVFLVLSVWRLPIHFQQDQYL